MSAYQAQMDPTDVLAKRYGAAVIDVVIEVAVWIAAFVLGFIFLSHRVIRYESTRFGPNRAYESHELTGTGWVVVLLIGFGYMIAVFVIQRGLTAKTPGTMVVGLAVVDEQGQPIGVPRALLRSVAGIVDYIGICSVPIVGIATTASSKGHRRVGDMAAKSFVVDQTALGQPVVVAGLNAPPTASYGQPYGTTGYGQPYAQPGQPGQPGQAFGSPYGQPGQPYGTPGQPYGQTAYPPPAGYPAAPSPPTATPDTGWPASSAPADPTPGPAADQAGWGAPGATDAPSESSMPSEPAATPEPATPGPEAAADPTQPQWDAARNAYIQWDPDGQRWLQYDDAAQQWRSIS